MTIVLSLCNIHVYCEGVVGRVGRSVVWWRLSVESAGHPGSGSHGSRHNTATNSASAACCKSNQLELVRQPGVCVCVCHQLQEWRKIHDFVKQAFETTVEANTSNGCWRALRTCSYGSLTFVRSRSDRGRKEWLTERSGKPWLAERSDGLSRVNDRK